MGINTRENPCAASGCVGACCYNITLYDVTGEQLETLIPEGTEVTYIPPENFQNYRRKTSAQIASLGSPNIPSSIYVAPTPNKATYSVFIAGRCPNLQADNSCGIYVQKPPQCELFNYGGQDCNTARERHGVPKLIATTIRRRVS